MGREIAAEVAARAREQFGRSAAGRAPLEHGLEHAVGGGALAGEQRPGAEVGAGVVLERIGPAVSEEPHAAGCPPDALGQRPTARVRGGHHRAGIGNGEVPPVTPHALPRRRDVGRAGALESARELDEVSGAGGFDRVRFRGSTCSPQQPYRGAITGDRPGVGAHQLGAHQLVVARLGERQHRAEGPPGRAPELALPLTPPPRAQRRVGEATERIGRPWPQQCLLERPHRLARAVELAALAQESALRPLELGQPRDQLARLAREARHRERAGRPGAVAQPHVAILERAPDGHPQSAAPLAAREQHDQRGAQRVLDLAVAELEPRAAAYLGVPVLAHLGHAPRMRDTSPGRQGGGSRRIGGKHEALRPGLAGSESPGCPHVAAAMKPAPGVDRVLRRARSPPVGRPRLGGIERHERGHGVRGLERELEFRRAWDRAAVVRDRQQRHDQPRVARRGLGKSHRLELPAHRTVPSGPIRHGTPALFEGDDLGRVGGRGIHEPGIGAGETARVELPASGLSRRPFDRRPHADHPPL